MHTLGSEVLEWFIPRNSGKIALLSKLLGNRSANLLNDWKKGLAAMSTSLAVGKDTNMGSSIERIDEWNSSF